MRTASLTAGSPGRNSLMQGSIGQLVFLLAVTLGVMIPWFAPHPPMTDLPQHAGQVALLRDMLLGQSPWAELFRINWITPYVIGYGLALPLSLFIPIATAFKLLLSAAYIAFVYMGMVLRRHFGADVRLDWLFLLPFFGFAYQWGFLTFLIAAPIGLWFILLADNYAQGPSARRGIGLTLAGALLLASHGLVFVFAVATGGCLLLARRGFAKTLKAIAPYLVLAVLCGIYFIISRKIQADMQSSISSEFIWSGGLSRLPKALIYALGVNAKGVEPLLFVPTALAMFALPWVLGLRPDLRNIPSWTPFAVVAGIMLFIPTFALDTQFLYQRFGLFLISTYAWMFTQSMQKPVFAGMRKGAPWMLPLTVILIGASLGLHAWKTWSFGRETAGIDTRIASLPLGQRALILMFDPAYTRNDTAKVYAHYPAWYQAERQGLVDFNFAWFPPQIVRYRPEHLPVAAPGFEWHPERFDWVQYHGAAYRYFFVRYGNTRPGNIFTGADCPPTLLFEGNHWQIFERKTCSAQ